VGTEQAVMDEVGGREENEKEKKSKEAVPFCAVCIFESVAQKGLSVAGELYDNACFAFGTSLKLEIDLGHNSSFVIIVLCRLARS
jgi:hypothetical protein